MEAPKGLSKPKAAKWVEVYRYYFRKGFNTNYAQRQADAAVKAPEAKKVKAKGKK